MKVKLAMLFIALSSSLPVGAAVPLKTYRAAREVGGNPWKEIKIYVDGFLNGLGYSNALLEKHGKEKMYCQPLNIKFNDDSINSLIEDTAKKDSSNDDTRIEVILMEGLLRTYSCKK
jgi:hypothetical protein